jgi:iron-sulfur cluster assembly protein
MQSTIEPTTNKGMADPDLGAAKQRADEADAQAKPKRTLAVSPKAVEAMRAQLAKRETPDGAIRVGIRGGGCSGFSYVIEFDDGAPRSGDLVMEFTEPDKAKVRVFCDKKSIIYLGGSVLDWEKTLMYQGFKFKNPQEATRCGCGHSFTVA